MTDTWRPTASIDDLRKRAEIIKKIRNFFDRRNVFEVDTPALSQASVTDIHLHPFKTQFVGPGYAKGLPLYLMTSPEFHMKRLLAASSGSIYQICKSFRNEEAGRYHNPEFTMLEWYRVKFDHNDLMNEIEALLEEILNCEKPIKQTYQEAFIEHIGICPLESSLEELKQCGERLGVADIIATEQNKDTVLQLLFSLEVETKIGKTAPHIIYNFPASQAALAKICEEDPRVAARFELYFKSIELANGFYELDDPKEQLKRFESDNKKRIKNGLNEHPVDMNLIHALEHGLPRCAGVAMGIDRLIMIALNKTHISEVTAFPVDNA